MMNSEICELIEACESEQSEQSEELLNEIIEHANIKPVIRYISFYQERVIQEMTHEELKAMNSKQLNKMIINEYVPDESMRFPLDLDIKPSEVSNKEVPNAITRIFETINERLTTTFGPYSYGGYTTNKTVADDYDIRYFVQERKTLSLHIIFYKSKVLRSDLYKVMNLLKRLSKAIINEFLPGFDVSVYKEPGKRQLLRHVMTNKANENGRETIDAWGTIAEGKTPDTQAVTPNGTEKLVTYDEIIKAFDFLLQKVPPTHQTNESRNESFAQFEHNEELEDLLVDIFKEALDNDKIEKIHCTQSCNIKSKLSIWYILQMFTALCDDAKNKAIEILRNCGKLSDKADTQFDNKINEIEAKGVIFPLKNLENFIKTYAAKSYTEIYAPAKKEAEEEAMRTFKRQFDIKEKLQYISDAKLKNPMLGKYDKIKLLACGLRYVSRFDIWLSRIGHNDIVQVKDEQLTRNIAVYIEKTGAAKQAMDTLRTIVGTAEIEQLDFNTMFTGWKYGHEPKSEHYEQNIKDFKDAVLTNTFNGDENVFNYEMSRIAYMLNNPGALSMVCLILKGIEGTGKNFYTDIICELMHGYSNGNAELSKVTGRFNISSFGKALIVCNEALNFGEDRIAQSEYIKKALERPTLDYEGKGTNTFTGSNNMNLIITSNNFKPVLLSPNDRRFCVSISSSVHANDREYWAYYQDEVIKRNGFYNDIFLYITKSPEFNTVPFTKLQIPQTRARVILQVSSFNPLQRFIYEHLDRFSFGITREEIKEFLDYEADPRIKSLSIAQITDQCNKPIRLRSGPMKGKYVYMLADGYANNLFNIRDFMEENETIESEDKEEDEKEAQNSINEYNKIIEGIKQTVNKFYCIKSSDIPKDNKKEIENYLTTNGWKFTTALTHSMRCRGFKKSIDEATNV